MVGHRREDLANRRPPMASLITTLGGIIAVVCSRCQSQRNYGFAMDRFEAVLTRKYNPNSARPRIFDGVAEAKLIALTLSPAPEGFARWSLRLLEEKVVELHIVERASDNTIGRTLKKTFSNRIASSNG